MKTIIRIIQFTAHCVVVAARQQMGRWYVFRDRPEWFVREVASMPLTEKDEGRVVALVKEARAEHGRRLDKELRDLEAMVRQSGFTELADTVAGVRDVLRHE